ncbi:hypothetical protein V1279_005488 [Bradyrhizobium sp. AZCC 1610]|uniref:hypothetical protein n=1 Tax=Bradyrhizobium sp. AZCC 1610 TaxID=3117020 RepID=UPI002FEF30BE
MIRLDRERAVLAVRPGGTIIQTLPMKFACPSIVLRDGDTNSGATEPFHAWSEAVAEG